MYISTQTRNLAVTPEMAEKYFPIIRKAGFSYIDFNISSIFKPDKNEKRFPILDLNMEQTLEYFNSIKNYATINNINIGQTHAHYPSLILGCGEEYNIYLFECLKKEIEITSKMGAKYIVIHPIFDGSNDGNAAVREWENNIKMYTALIDTLKKWDVVCCLENMWMLKNGKILSAACADPREAAAYIDELNNIAGEERFGYCFDTGHATICGLNVPRAMHILGKRIKALHLHDVQINDDSHTCPYLGIADWDSIMRTLVEIGYEGTLNFEASNAWNQYPKEVWPEAIMLLGKIAQNFVEKYFCK